MAVFGGSAPYYNKDGALRAHANRVVVLASVLALVVVVLAAIVLVTRSKPPLVIRIGPDGQASVISPTGTAHATRKLVASAAVSEAPNETEKEAFVVRFVNAYWGYDEHTIADHWSQALNMMTSQLERAIFSKMSSDGTVGTLQSQHVKSTVTITSIESDQADPLVYHVLASRIEVKATGSKSYTATKNAEEYTIHLVEAQRSIRNPSGLLVSGFTVNRISGEPYLLDQQ